MPPRRFKKSKRKRRPTNKPRTKVDKKLSRRISRLENSIETKYIDSTVSEPMDVAGASYAVISGMGQGDDYNQRIGNKITSKRLYLQYRLFVPASDSPALIRFILYWDNQFNSGNFSQLFTGTSPTPEILSSALLDDRSGMISVNAPYNINTKQRYKILYDTTHTMNRGSDLVGLVLNIKKSISLHNAQIIYADTTATNISIPSRMLMVSYFYTVSTDVPTINYTSRYFFTDL